jgi:hypothetical protein
MREGEPTGWTCDRCGKAILGGEPCYGLVANKETKKTRHWKCHTPISEAFAELRKSTSKAEAILDTLKDRLRK